MLIITLWMVAGFIATAPPTFLLVCWLVGQPVWPFIQYSRGRKPKSVTQATV